MSAHAEPFLAYVRTPDGTRGSTKVVLETAVSYDIAGGIDERNGWVEPNAELTHDQLAAEIEAEARQLREFILFCWEGIALDDEIQFNLAIRRFCSVAFVLFPNVLCTQVERERGQHGRYVVVDGTPISLAALSRLVTCDPKTMKRLAAQFLERIDAAAA
jgi:hypothetical protein